MQIGHKSPFVRTDHFPFKTCGNFSCPYCAKSAARMKVKALIGKIDGMFNGSSPAPFVGRFGYPFVNVGMLAPPEENAENSWRYDAPKFWSSQHLQIPEIVDYRSSLVNSHFKSDIHSPKSGEKSKLLEISQEVGLASRPVDLELNLAGKPSLRMSVDSASAPTGPTVVVKNARLTSNPTVAIHVEKVVSDTDLKSSEALNYLFSKGYDENFLTRLLSVGNLGLKTNRKLVPTRWSITAIDDTLGKNILNELRDFQSYGYFAYFGGYLGNYFLIMFFPENWSYELFETAAGMADYTTDYEPFTGRKAYAENCAGGYYAARLAILEFLQKLKRQSSVLAIRFITGEYTVPLGVWVVREAVRNALQSTPIEFGSSELMLNYASALSKKKFGRDLSTISSHSILLVNIKQQRKLSEYS
jgi:DNA repair protein NreA